MAGHRRRGVLTTLLAGTHHALPHFHTISLRSSPEDSGLQPGRPTSTTNLLGQNFKSPPIGHFSRFLHRAQTSTSCLRNVPGFTSAIDGTIKSFTRAHVTADAQYRALATANALLTEGTYIYSVGLGTNVDKAFLQQIANDPSSSTYNPNLPAGMAMFAPNCPSSTCTADMQQIFQTIAAQILLPLTLYEHRPSSSALDSRSDTLIFAARYIRRA